MENKLKFVFLYHYYVDKIKALNRVEFPPLGMLYVCSSLLSVGHDVEVFYFDQNTSRHEIPEADVYALSISATSTYQYYKQIAKKIQGKGLIFAGNTHATIFSSFLLKDMNIDAIFQGEGELSIIDWINRKMPRKIIVPAIYTDNIDFSFPARHLIHEKFIYMQNRIGGKCQNSISIITSRGCKYNCQFCAIQNRGNVRFRTPNDIEKELDYIIKMYKKCDGITLLDETFTQNELHALNVIKLITARNLPFECNSRVDTLTPKIIESLKNSTCAEVRIGIETGSQYLLDKMKKGINIDDAKKTLIRLNKNNIKIKLYLMHGYLGENIKTTIETINFIRLVEPYIERISLYRFTPLPGSPVYTSAEIKKRDWKDYTIYDNTGHWWGNQCDYEEMQTAYLILEEEVKRINDKKK